MKMKSIKIINSVTYIPEIEIDNKKLEQMLNLEEGYIIKRTGIKKRYKTNLSIEEMAKKLADKIKIQILKNNEEKKNKEEEIQEIDLIIVSTTTPSKFMPSISNIIQKELGISKCICLDVLAGCAGFINAIDIVQKYMVCSEIRKALVVGIEQLSKFVDIKDVSTSILMSDGAGAILLEQTDEPKMYFSEIYASADDKNMLNTNIEFIENKVFCRLQMNGKEIYKYAVTETIKNIQKLLEKSCQDMDNIKYIVPHQSNLKIIKAIQNRIETNIGKNIKEKMYINIQNIGNTFCASIPLALNQMIDEGKLSRGDKIILLSYGGGMNTGSILIEF